MDGVGLMILASIGIVLMASILVSLVAVLDRPKKQVQVVVAPKRAWTIKEPKFPALTVAESFAEPNRAEFALPLARELHAIHKAAGEFVLLGEASLVQVVKLLVSDATKVLSDYAKTDNLGAERRLQLKRIVSSIDEVVKSYRTYRVSALDSGRGLDEAVIDEVVKEVQTATEAVMALCLNHQKDALNRLAIELHVLRDVTRR